MQNRIYFRRDTAANWTSVNPVLAVGELGYEIDTTKCKMGDGTTAWSSLPYWKTSTPLTTTYFVDKVGNDTTGDGTIQKPYLTIQKVLTTIGQPTSAADYQRRFEVYVSPGEYSENLTVPHRAVSIIGRGVKIVGNITREIGDEYEYGISSSTFRGCLSLIGQADARDTHQRTRQSIWVTGFYRCKVESGKTGFTTHDTFFENTRIDGAVQSDDGIINSGATSVGQEVLYSEGCRFEGSVEGGFYLQRLTRTRTTGTLAGSSMVNVDNCEINGAVTVGAFVYESGIRDTKFATINFTVTSAGQSVYMDGVTRTSASSNVTWVTNTPTIVKLDDAIRPGETIDGGGA